MTDKRKNINFVQLYKHNIKELRELNVKNPMAFNIFMYLMEHMNKYNAVVCSQVFLQEYFNKGRSCIYKAVKDLKAANLITMGKIGSAMAYTLNPEVVWANWNDSKKHCQFEGTVFMTKSENKDLDKRMKEMQAALAQRNKKKVV